MSNPKNPFRSRTWTIGSRHVSNGLTNTTMWPLGPLSTQPTHVGWYSLVPKLVGTEFIMRRCGWSQPSMMTAGSTPLMSEERRRVESLRTHGDPSFLPAPPRSLSSSSHFVFLFHFSTSHFFSFTISDTLHAATIVSITWSLDPPTHCALVCFPIVIFHSTPGRLF